MVAARNFEKLLKAQPLHSDAENHYIAFLPRVAAVNQCCKNELVKNETWRRHS